MASLTITIEVTGGDPVVKIKDSGGTEKTVTGLALFGMRPDSGEFYGFSWGCPDHVAQSVSEIMAQAFNRGDEWYIEFYRALLAQMVKRTGVAPPGAKFIEADDLLKRWEAEDATKAAAVPESEDPTKWN